MSYRRLWILVSKLPAESWTQTELRDAAPPVVVEDSPEPRFGPWALINYQLAQLLDAVRRLEYIDWVAGGLTPEATPPAPSPRPGLATVRPLRTPKEIEYLENLRAKGA